MSTENERLIVAKFGGTSMGSADSISKVADIVKGLGAGARCAVVVSATSGTTDELLRLGSLALENGGWERALKELIEKHDVILGELGIELDLSAFWRNTRNLLDGISLMGELSESASDRLVTGGERVSASILSALLRERGIESEMMDAHEFVFTDAGFGDARVDFSQTDEAVRRDVGALLEEGMIPVITGFTGQAPDGRYTTLGRGGSDYTAAIVGSALNASEVQIWTDVDGIFNTDPRLVESASVLDQLSFNEAGELAYFGAKVLHPKTIRPAVEKNIPVRILNTFNPSAEGTLITNKEEDSLKSVTAKKGIRIVNICSAGMLDAHGFLEKIFKVFADNNVVVDVVSTSEVSVSVTIDHDLPEEAHARLSEFATVKVYDDLAIVCLVGSGIRSNKGVLGDLFSSVSDHAISMVSVGASKRNVTFLVKEDEASEVVTKVFNQFFNN
ncbi:aspartate kinase [Candidatus Peregrinibacteria bacterium]|nr:aspartate kinase [Candidatus Peregrinibacteria bacterium]